MNLASNESISTSVALDYQRTWLLILVNITIFGMSKMKLPLFVQFKFLIKVIFSQKILKKNSQA